MAKVKLTKADREFMTRGERRKAADEKRRAVDRAERAPPTPETLAKLIPDPLAVMLDLKLITAETKDAALELGEVYVAVYGAQRPGARGAGGNPVMSDKVAWIHSKRYLPWARKWSKIRFQSMPLQPAVIDLVVDGCAVGLDQVARALIDYAQIRAANPLPNPAELVRETV